MKFLADMNMSMSTVQSLRENGHDIIHLREQGLGRLPDVAVIGKAKEEGRIVLTFDLDFGDLMAASRDALPSVVIFRLRDETPPAVLPRLQEVLAHCRHDLLQGALVVVSDARTRVRRLPLSEADDPQP